MKVSRRHSKSLILLIITIVLILVSCKRTDDKGNDHDITLTISAASDLTPAFQELGEAFEKLTGVKIIFNFGSSGQLAEQIKQGAPVDVYASANMAYVDELDEEGLIFSDTKALYAEGHITIWMPNDSALELDSLEDLTNSEIERIAIANPDHAPYGVAAREALQSVGIWDAVSSKLLLGENIAQTLSYAQTGEVDVAIVALSLSIPSDGYWVLIPAELHNPLNQGLAVLKNTQYEEESRQFAAYVNSDEGRTIMRKYGFVLPGEEPVVTQ
jgi:molybdate transport system substrate-binding protein